MNAINIVLFFLSFYSISSARNDTVEEYVKYISEYINYTSTYKVPVDNSKLIETTDGTLYGK